VPGQARPAGDDREPRSRCGAETGRGGAPQRSCTCEAGLLPPDLFVRRWRRPGPQQELLDTLLKVSEGRYAVGHAAQQDVIKAQTQLSILELQQQRIDQERVTYAGELNVLLNRPSTAPVGRPDDLVLVPFESSLESLFLGRVPIMWSTGTGADVMKRIAAPMVGGILTSFMLELVVYPAMYEIWKRLRSSRGSGVPNQLASSANRWTMASTACGSGSLVSACTGANARALTTRAVMASTDRRSSARQAVQLAFEAFQLGASNRFETIPERAAYRRSAHGGVGFSVAAHCSRRRNRRNSEPRSISRAK